MIQTYEARLKAVVYKTSKAESTFDKESIMQEFDGLLMNVFTLVNESIEKHRDSDFIRDLQRLELEIAEAREVANTKLFKL